jgi:hypothetical protein
MYMFSLIRYRQALFFDLSASIGLKLFFLFGFKAFSTYAPLVLSSDTVVVYFDIKIHYYKYHIQLPSLRCSERRPALDRTGIMDVDTA